MGINILGICKKLKTNEKEQEVFVSPAVLKVYIQIGSRSSSLDRCSCDVMVTTG